MPSPCPQLDDMSNTLCGHQAILNLLVSSTFPAYLFVLHLLCAALATDKELGSIGRADRSEGGLQAG